MKENLTSINVIIDESGSMFNLSQDTIGSFNTFLEEQKAVDGEALFTLCTFSNSHRLVHDCANLKDVQPLDSTTYRPSGGTALLDALGTTVINVGNKLADMKEEDRPSKVIFLVITDGQENSSREFKREQIKEMVERQQKTYSWDFVFIGANVDAFSEGTSMGFSAGNSLSYSADSMGTASLYGAVSKNMSVMRGRSKDAPKVDNFFDNTGERPDGTKVPVENVTEKK